MNNKKTFISLAAVIAVVAGVIGIAAVNRKPAADTVPTTTETTDSTTLSQVPVADTPSQPSTPPKKTSSEYKDGTYSAVGSYRSPGGSDDLNVTVTIKNDTVTAVTVTSGAHDGTSSRYQAMFISGYQPLVVGKKVDSVHLDTVSGSSLTGIGFNDAFAKIKAQAKA